MNEEELNELDIILDRHLIWLPAEGIKKIIKDDLRETLIKFINGITIDILSHAAAEVPPRTKQQTEWEDE